MLAVMLPQLGAWICVDGMTLAQPVGRLQPASWSGSGRRRYSVHYGADSDFCPRCNPLCARSAVRVGLTEDGRARRAVPNDPLKTRFSLTIFCYTARERLPKR